MINMKKVEPARYYELLERDVLSFGHSSRTYVVLNLSTVAGVAVDDDENAAEDDGVGF